MGIPRRLESWLAWFPWYRRQAREASLERELRDHLDLEAEEQRAAGLSPEDAARAARRALGSVLRIEEDVRTAWGFRWLETLLHDVRYGLRMLRKSPGFTAVAVLTIALGIGVNTALFSLVDFLIVRPIPVRKPGQLVLLTSVWKDGGSGTGFSYPDFRDIRKQTGGVFSSVSALGMYNTDGLTSGARSQPLWTVYVSGDFFDQMGIKPALGRLILPADGRLADASPALALSYAYWQSHFGGDPGVVGKHVLVNGRPLTIVGVAPRHFHGLSNWEDDQGYMPLGMASVLKDLPPDFQTSRRAADLVLVARLRPHVNLHEAQSVLKVIGDRMAIAHPKSDGWITLRPTRLGPSGLNMSRPARSLLPLAGVLVLSLAGVVLLLACVNVANLYLVRAGVRQREMAMRAALGGTRGRLVCQLLTESLTLAVFGCAAGMVLGFAGSRLLSALPLRAPLPLMLDFRFDWRVFAYGLGAAALTAVLVGIVPALRVARGDLNDLLHRGGRSSTPGAHRLRRALVTTQVAASLMLLIVAGLFVRSLENVRRENLGFDPNHVYNFSLEPHEAGYGRARAREFLQEILDRVRSLPGVQSASLASSVPMGYHDFESSFKIPGYEPSHGQPALLAGVNSVSTQYFETMRIPLMAGRGFRRADSRSSRRVAVVNERMAERYWHGRTAIGRTFTFDDRPREPIEIVGIVRNSRDDDMFTSNDSFVYVPFFQGHNDVAATLQVRATLPFAVIARQVISLVHGFDPTMPVFDVRTMTGALDTLNGFFLFRFAAALAGAIGLLGLILATVGVYGVISYLSSQRTHEIGVRMALGARPGQVLTMVLRSGLTIAAFSLPAGLLAAVAISRLLDNFLVNVRPFDPLSYTAAALLLGLVVLAASYLPARRATKVDPTTALRAE